VGVTCLIVCHAGRQIGLGHLTRSLVAATALGEALDAGVSLLIQGESVERPDLAATRHRFVTAEEDLVEAVMHSVQEVGPSVVVFDLSPRHEPAGIARLLDGLRREGRKLVSVDGLTDQRSRLDLLFIPSFRCALPPALPGEAPVVFGWDCFLLGGEQAPVQWKPGNRVLALTGGSDTTRLGATLPELLDRGIDGRSEVHWVVGPYAALPVGPVTAARRMVFHHSPAGLTSLMSKANYCITVLGVSFFELLRLGVPTVVFSPYGSKDADELSALASEGVALVAENEVDAVDKLRVLMGDDRLAADLSRRAALRMAGSGGQRLAEAVAAMGG
jgi:spore coat polysaccharide biosynthesis predicted glycosyltransferase SpsG